MIRFGGSTGAAELRATIEALPEWYLADLAAGSIVEELITGSKVNSPSVQVDILPSGEPVVLATHEQMLGGPDGQVYVGCRFPASPDYAARLGRFSVDFMCAQAGNGSWDVFALEINLRKGGTTHPYAALRISRQAITRSTPGSGSPLTVRSAITSPPPRNRRFMPGPGSVTVRDRARAQRAADRR